MFIAGSAFCETNDLHVCPCLVTGTVRYFFHIYSQIYIIRPSVYGKQLSLARVLQCMCMNVFECIPVACYSPTKPTNTDTCIVLRVECLPHLLYHQLMSNTRFLRLNCTNRKQIYQHIQDTKLSIFDSFFSHSSAQSLASVNLCLLLRIIFADFPQPPSTMPSSGFQ